jgi:hypothetical protein
VGQTLKIRYSSQAIPMMRRTRSLLLHTATYPPDGITKGNGAAELTRNGCVQELHLYKCIIQGYLKTRCIMRLHNALRLPLVLAAIAAAPGFAAGNGNLEHAEKVLEGAKTTLAQAISTAENQVGGKALSARLVRRHQQDLYDVNVVKGNELTEVDIAIEDGKVLSTRPIVHGHMAKAKPAAEKTEQPGRG